MEVFIVRSTSKTYDATLLYFFQCLQCSQILNLKMNFPFRKQKSVIYRDALAQPCVSTKKISFQNFVALSVGLENTYSIPWV